MKPFYSEPGIDLYLEDARRMANLGNGIAQACVTSPPYWGGLRDYGHPEQIGLERNPADWAGALVEVFRGVARVLSDDGVLWLNVGDVYAASGKGGGGNRGDRACWDSVRERKGFRMPPDGFKKKDLTLAPFLLANALRDDGWYLRSTIIWKKPAAVEPMRLDRPATSHEYLFLCSRSEDYAVRNPGEPWWGHSVWDITQDRLGTHQAPMPRELARRCIASSTKPGDLVIDPFNGGGTTGIVSREHGRTYVGFDLNPQYLEQTKVELSQQLLFGTAV